MIKIFFYKIRLSLSLSIFSFIVFACCAAYWVHLHHKVEVLQHRLASLNHLALRSQEAAAVFKTYPKDFETFEACSFALPHTAKTFQKSFPHSVEFGVLSPLDKDGFVSQEVSFFISCLQDQDIFSLVEQFINQGPGFFQIHEISITRLGPLTEELLKKVAAGIPTSLFEGKIIATWIHR